MIKNINKGETMKQEVQQALNTLANVLAGHTAKLQSEIDAVANAFKVIVAELQGESEEAEEAEETEKPKKKTAKKPNGKTAVN